MRECETCIIGKDQLPSQYIETTLGSAGPIF